MNGHVPTVACGKGEHALSVGGTGFEAPMRPQKVIAMLKTTPAPLTSPSGLFVVKTK